MSRTLPRQALALLLWIGLSGCSHALHQYHVSDNQLVRPGTRAKRISSVGQQQVVLGIADNTDYVNHAFQSLEQQCRGGFVTNIHTRYSTSHGFFHWTNKVQMTAQCVDTKAAAAKN